MGRMPRLIEPMMASLRRGLPPDDDTYGWEFKLSATIDAVKPYVRPRQATSRHLPEVPSRQRASRRDRARPVEHGAAAR